MPVLRNDQASIAATLDGTPITGGWTGLTGFDATAADTKTRDPDGKEFALGGPQSVDNGSISRPYDPVKDDYNGWNAKRGVGVIQITTRGKDANGNPYGPPTVYSGILQGATLSDRAPDGGSERTVTLNVVANSDIGG